MIRSGADDERRHDDDSHLQRLDFGARQRVRLSAVDTHLVKMHSRSAALVPGTLSYYSKINVLVNVAQCLDGVCFAFRVMHFCLSPSVAVLAYEFWGGMAPL